MANNIEIKIEKFLPLTGLYFLTVVFFFIGIPLLYIDRSPEGFILIPALFFLVGAIFHQKGMRKNSVILKATDEGIYLPHRGFSLHWQAFISWKDFIKIDKVTEAGIYLTRLHSVAVFYKSKKTERTQFYSLPYSVGKGQALNYPKDEIIKLITRAAQNG